MSVELAPRPRARREVWIDRAIALALFVVTVLSVAQTAQELGFTRDEGYYFKAAELYWGWFEDGQRFAKSGELGQLFDKSTIDRHWNYNHEHPVLVKTMFALSWGILKDTLGWFDSHSNGFRFPAWLFAGLCIALLYSFSRWLGLRRWAAILAAGSFLAMPRAYWHMHLACFDIPVCAAHLWLVYGYARYRKTAPGALWIGVLFGLAAAVKHNVLIAPAIFVLHWLLLEAKTNKWWSKRGLHLPAIPLSFFSLAFIGPIVFVLHWPYLWPDIMKRVGWYLGFHLNHEHYPILWFGDLLTAPPFPVSFPFVMSAVTIPSPILGLFVLGAVLGAIVCMGPLLRRIGASGLATRLHFEPKVKLGPAEETAGHMPLLLLLNIAYPFALIAMPSSPIFGGTKHWMNALPFLGILGAWAVQEAVERVRSDPRFRFPKFTLEGALVVLTLLPGFLETARIHPYGLASYNDVIGYARGAANTGFQRTFWGYEPRLFLPEVNARTGARGRILFGDTNRDDYKMYRREGLLREDISITGSPSSSAVSVVQPQGEFKDQYTKTLDAYGVNGPDRVIHIEGVPVGAITFHPQRSPPPADD